MFVSGLFGLTVYNVCGFLVEFPSAPATRGCSLEGAPVRNGQRARFTSGYGDLWQILFAESPWMAIPTGRWHMIPEEGPSTAMLTMLSVAWRQWVRVLVRWFGGELVNAGELAGSWWSIKAQADHLQRWQGSEAGHWWFLVVSPLASHGFKGQWR